MAMLKAPSFASTRKSIMPCLCVCALRVESLNFKCLNLHRPKGIFTGRFYEVDGAMMDTYRNTGGFDMLGAGRDKIESKDEFAVGDLFLTFASFALVVEAFKCVVGFEKSCAKL